MGNPLSRFAALGLVLLALAWAVPGLRAGNGPRGEEATHRLMTESLLAERDLIFDHRDVQRSYRAWPQGPEGLLLLSHDEGRSFRYALPVAYALAALPFRGLFGEAGFYLLNLALFLAAWGLARQDLAQVDSGRRLFLAGFFVASAAFGFTFRVGPQALSFSLVTMALLLGRRAHAGSPVSSWVPAALSGLALGVAVSLEPVAAVALAVVILDALAGRRWRSLGIMVLAGLLAWCGLAMAALRLQGTVSPATHVEARRFGDLVPIEGPAGLWRETPPESRLAERGFPRSGAAWALDVGYLAGGRSTGLLPLYPFVLLALGLSLGGSWERASWLPALGFLTGLTWVVATPVGLPGADLLAGLGDPRLAGLVPLVLLLPARAPGPALSVATWLAAGLFTLPALWASMGPARASAPGALALLPLELTRWSGTSPGGSELSGLPGYQARVFGEAVWLLPRDRFFLDEKNPRGVWMRGASEAEVIVVAPQPLERLNLVVVALAADTEVQLEGGRGTERIHFDSAGKRAGAPVSLPLSPLAADLGGLFPRETYYRLRISCTSGAVPARRDAASLDTRYLGAFFDFGFEGE